MGGTSERYNNSTKSNQPSLLSLTSHALETRVEIHLKKIELQHQEELSRWLGFSPTTSNAPTPTRSQHRLLLETVDSFRDIFIHIN